MISGIHRISQTAYNKGKDTKVFIRYKSPLKRYSIYSGYCFWSRPNTGGLGLKNI